MNIAVCIVDDNKDIRSALEQIIQMSELSFDWKFLFAEEAIKNIPILKPNVVLMDIDSNDVSTEFNVFSN
jgi:FixJ family two-component response regulator